MKTLLRPWTENRTMTSEVIIPVVVFDVLRKKSLWGPSSRVDRDKLG